VRYGADRPGRCGTNRPAALRSVCARACAQVFSTIVSPVDACGGEGVAGSVDARFSCVAVIPHGRSANERAPPLRWRSARSRLPAPGESFILWRFQVKNPQKTRNCYGACSLEHGAVKMNMIDVHDHRISPAPSRADPRVATIVKDVRVQTPSMSDAERGVAPGARRADGPRAHAARSSSGGRGRRSTG
jgi:hypothetical protein